MRKSFATVLVVGMLMASFVNNPALANESEFKISDYIPEKFEDFEWRLDGNFRLTGSESDNLPYIFDYQSREYEQTDWRADLTSYHAYSYETVPKFLNASLSTRVNTSLGDRESRYDQPYTDYPDAGITNYDKSNSTNYRFDIRPTVDAGKYLAENMFLSSMVSGLFYYDESPDTETHRRRDELSIDDSYITTSWRDTQGKNRSDNRRFSVTAELLPGWGRMYEGSHASTAMYMIDELKNNGALLREPTSEEMTELCNIVYQNRLKHAVDYRIRRIETFDEILQYLSTAGISDADGHYGYLLIQDVWDYFPRDGRRFGLRTRVGVGATYGHSRLRSTSDSFESEFAARYHLDSADIVGTLYEREEYRYASSRTEAESRDLYAKGMIEYSYPLSRRWQIDLVGYTRYFFDSYETYDRAQVYLRERDYDSYSETQRYEERQEFSSRYLFGLSTSAAFIYNSRTRADFDVFYAYNRFVYETARDSFDDTDHETVSAGDVIKSFELTTSLTYRLSIPTTFRVAVSYLHDSPGSGYRERQEWLFLDDLAVVDHASFLNASRYYVSVSLQHYLY